MKMNKIEIIQKNISLEENNIMSQLPFDKDNIKSIIFSCISKERCNTNWNEYKVNILNNFSNINFMESIENYIPCQRKLHITRPKLREQLHNDIQRLNEKIFEEYNYDAYRPKEGYKITFKELCDFVEECVKILVKKQQLI